MKLLASISSFTNAIASFAEGKAVRYLMPPQLFQTKNFGGLAVQSSSRRGRKNPGSALIVVPPAALPFRIRLGTCLTSGFLLDGNGDLEIVAHLCVASKAAWNSTLLQGACYDELPNLSELISLLQATNA